MCRIHVPFPVSLLFPKNAVTTPVNNRILIVDDNPAIHEDFRKILTGGQREDQETDDLLNAVLGRGGNRAAGFRPAAETGMVYSPFADEWLLSSDMDVNFMIAARRS